jgi:hypothetical protein
MKGNCGYANVAVGAISMISLYEFGEGRRRLFPPMTIKRRSFGLGPPFGKNTGRPDALELSQSSTVAAIATSQILLTSSEPWI